MLSLICCSQYETVPEQLAQNVQDTIGTDYEWIWIYNQNNKYSIFEAYNIGVAKANGNILCFMHQDLEFQSYEWGNEVERLLFDKNIDACAVAGTDYYRKSPSYYPCGRGHNKINVIQSTDSGDVKWQDYDSAERLAVFDGMWFCIKKHCFEKIRFDDSLYSGFHFYDIDIATQLWVNNMSVYTLPNVWIKHFSEGNPNVEWLRNAFKFYGKWKCFMPLQLRKIEHNEQMLLECQALYSALRNCIRYREWDLLKLWFKIAGEVLETQSMVALFKVLKVHMWKI